MEPLHTIAAPSRQSRFAGADAARRAVMLARPSIEAALEDRAVSGMGVLHVVVMDPAVGPSESGFDDALLHEELIGDASRCDVDYGVYARAKARLSWQHGMDSRQLQWLSPHRLSEDESLLWGGVWLDGIVVATSGAMPVWDEVFALTVAGYLRALAFERAEAARHTR